MAKQYQEIEVDDYTTILFETDDDDEPLNATDLLCILNEYEFRCIEENRRLKRKRTIVIE